LSREELLNLSSKGMEKYIHQLKQTRDLSRDEEKELKKQRRYNLSFLTVICTQIAFLIFKKD